MAVAVAGNGAGSAYFDSVRSYFPCGTKSLRACIQCRIVMEKNQFFELGCPQCPELQITENEGRVAACTTQNFEGYISNIRPGGFATRFTGLEKRMPGFYALVVRGEIPSQILNGDELDESVRDLIDDGDVTPLSAISGGTPKAKKRKLDGTFAQSPSSPSSVTSDRAPEMGMDDRAKKALGLILDSESESDVDASGRPKDQVIPSGSEMTGVTRTHTASGTESRTERPSGAEAGEHSSASESQQSKKSADSRRSRESRTSNQTATSDRSRSIAILEPEVDTEFERAPK